MTTKTGGNVRQKTPRTFPAQQSRTFPQSDRMVEPNATSPRNVPEQSAAERSTVPPPLHKGGRERSALRAQNDPRKDSVSATEISHHFPIA
jgi:hypothetical protein